MRVRPNLEQEFTELCAEYEAHDVVGKDIIALVEMFGSKYWHISHNGIPDYVEPLDEFLEEHQSQMTLMPMVGLFLYLLVTYWEDGHLMAHQLPVWARMAIRDTVSDIEEEIKRRSADHGNASSIAPE